MSDKRIYKANEIFAGATGWIADLSGGAVNKDNQWPFETRSKAQKFVKLVDSGMDAVLAASMVYEEMTTSKRGGARPNTGPKLSKITVKIGDPLRIEGQQEIYTVTGIDKQLGRKVLTLEGNMGSVMRIML